ncbi:hypothetical protein HYS97_00615 [Candidatus Daviesbacteria bacterium]|nr:hypothetical protein [Candidatus Daviesbacteria bacterium]
MKYLISLIILITSLFLLPQVSAAKKPLINLAQNTRTTQTIIGSEKTNLTECKFTRSDQVGNENLPFASHRLLSYFWEASQKTGIPVGVLGGIARIESTTDQYSISNYSNQDIEYIEQSDIPETVLTANNATSEIAKIKNLKIPSSNKAVCPVSSNNALGIMQIQPPGTNGHDAKAVNQGASLLEGDKNATNLTLKDYCNPRTSIIMSAGFILNKQGTTKWTPGWTNNKDFITRVARSYYGGLIYGGQDQYSYGDDLWNSVLSCRDPIFDISPITQTQQSSSPYCKAPDFSEYTQKYGFNSTNGKDYSYPNPTVEKYKQDFINAKEKAIKHAPKFGVDPVLAVWWVFYETGNPNSYNWSNCADTVKGNVDYNCPSTDSGKWQLGYGQQFATYRSDPNDPKKGLLAAFSDIYGDVNNKVKTKEVGQDVLNSAGQTRTFPDKSIQELVNEWVQYDDPDARYWMSVLMRDPDISMYLLSSALAGYDSQNPILKDRAAGWSSYYKSSWQATSNLMNDVIIAWNSTPCVAGTPVTAPSVNPIGKIYKSKRVCVRVGNPLFPSPCDTEIPSEGQPPAEPGKPGAKPVAPTVEESELREKIILEFGIRMDGFSAQYLKWAWEKFWDIKNTRFNELVRGAGIVATTPANTQQVGCRGGTSVLLGQFGDENTWKQVLIHELGHVVRNCNPQNRIQWIEHERALTQEGGVSDYGNKAKSCTGSDNGSEDYAEMIAYYLNPGNAVSTVTCFPPQFPNMKQDFPLHYNIAREVLGDY